MSARLYTKKVYWKMRLGFTLIELLVTISIISMLSSVVMATLSGARNKANDSKIKSQLRSFRTAAEIYRANTSANNYGTPVPGVGTAPGTIGAGCGSGIFSDPIVSPFALSKNYPAYANGTGRCIVTADSKDYIIVAKLADGQYWCVDSAGNATTLNNFSDLASLTDSCIISGGGGGGPVSS